MILQVPLLSSRRFFPPREPAAAGRAAASRQVLQDLVTQGLAFPLEYRQALANHLPMALQALLELGASPQRLREFNATYATRFEGLARPEPAPPAADWLALRGQQQAYPALRACFERALANEGQDDLLRRVLPDLLSAPGTAAFHGLIRSAHAVQSGHGGELAAALAYWASRWQALAPPPAASARLPLPVWSARLLEGAQAWRSEQALIQARMVEASQTAWYQSLAGALAAAPDLPTRVGELAHLALSLYLHSGNFTVLHMVTGLRALRVLLPWLDRAQDLQAPLVRAVVAACLAGRIKPLSARPGLPKTSWAAVIGAAIASDDEHVIKLVHACVEESAFYGEARYLEAAALATAAATSTPRV